MRTVERDTGDLVPGHERIADHRPARARCLGAPVQVAAAQPDGTHTHQGLGPAGLRVGLLVEADVTDPVQTGYADHVATLATPWAG